MLTIEERLRREALRDRPGRFDRIYQIGRPSAELAEQIARYYLKERGISEEIIEGLSYTSLAKGDLTGAQIVEVVKGGIGLGIGYIIPSARWPVNFGLRYEHVFVSGTAPSLVAFRLSWSASPTPRS